MAEPGLTQRLRRHSQRSGMMVGVSMAIAMAIAIGGFIWLYVQIGPLLSDFIPQQQSSVDETEPGSSGFLIQPRSTPEDSEGATDSPTPTSGDEPAEDATLTPDNTETITIPTPSPSPSPTPEPAWQPTHEIRVGPAVNFRSGPNTISPPHGALPPGTPLRFLDDTVPAGGVTWMSFENEDGLEGWIRDIDVIEIEPDNA